TVLGRADAVIVTGGENVHPAQVERVLLSHPGVVEARVFGIPDDEWGRRVVAEVVLEGATAAQLRQWAESRLTTAQLPKDWRPVEAVKPKLGE
ncbi:MAG: AMP-dependent synthetase, partial [Actinomycetota bacterium]|nr:AMP-dependent synthetase [Actinomycetota bacterium]